MFGVFFLFIRFTGPMFNVCFFVCFLSFVYTCIFMLFAYFHGYFECFEVEHLKLNNGLKNVIVPISFV